MSSVNLFTREISIKIVFYGPGLGGKTTSLQYIHRALKADSRGQLVSLATGVDRTLYFDFLPVKLPKLRGYSIRVQLYTVPGQVHYNSTRKLVLAGCDGVVFVADSQPGRETANVESLENLRENLAEQNLRLHDLPHIFEYNKRDIDGALAVADLQQRLNQHGVPSFETVATTGRGIFEALKAITTLVLNDLRRRGVWDGGQDARMAPREFDRTDTSIVQRIQALSEAAEAVQQLEPASDPTSRHTAPMFTVGGTPSPNGQTVPNPMSSGQSGLTRLPVPPRSGRSMALSELLSDGPARDQLLAVEAELAKSDYNEAVRLAARAFSEAARAVSREPQLAPVLHALVLGVGGARYLRFCDVAARAEKGDATLEDALYASFFLADAALPR